MEELEVEGDKEMKRGLCIGRHDIPEVGEYIFNGDIENPTDVEALRKTAEENLACLDRGDELHLYVTGLTVALGAVVSHCAKEGISLTLYHFDRDTGSYFPQPLF